MTKENPHIYHGLKLFINSNPLHNKIYSVLGSLNYALNTRDDSWKDPSKSQEQIDYIDQKWEEYFNLMREAKDSVEGKLTWNKFN